METNDVATRKAKGHEELTGTAGQIAFQLISCFARRNAVGRRFLHIKQVENIFYFKNDLQYLLR